MFEGMKEVKFMKGGTCGHKCVIRIKPSGKERQESKGRRMLSLERL